jgi:hypothetical protein
MTGTLLGKICGVVQAAFQSVGWQDVLRWVQK